MIYYPDIPAHANQNMNPTDNTKPAGSAIRENLDTISSLIETLEGIRERRGNIHVIHDIVLVSEVLDALDPQDCAACITACISYQRLVDDAGLDSAIDCVRDVMEGRAR